MSVEKKEVKELYEKVFGKKPHGRKTLETLQKEITKHYEECQDKVQVKLGELIEVSKSPKTGEATMISVILGEGGIHMSVSGSKQDLAIVIATAMSNNEDLSGVIEMANTMVQMKRSHEEDITKQVETEA